MSEKAPEDKEQKAEHTSLGQQTRPRGPLRNPDGAVNSELTDGLTSVSNVGPGWVTENSGKILIAVLVIIIGGGIWLSLTLE